MALTLNISTGVIDKGDRKKLVITPQDDSDPPVAFDLADLVVVFTAPSGDVTTYAENAAGEEVEIDPPSSSVYTILHTFDEAGRWTIKVTGADGNGSPEVETGRVYVADN